MPRRNLIFANDEIYHVYNRSVANEDILVKKNEIKRCLKLLDYYRYPTGLRYSKFRELSKKRRIKYLNNRKGERLVDVYTFALMPDHYHLLLKQLTDGGIRGFVSIFQNSYAKYFNKKNDRHGGLFQSPFKAKRIASSEIFTHVSRYIHLNPVSSYLMDYDDLKDSLTTSYPYYLGKSGGSLVSTVFLLKMFGSSNRYEKFISNQVDYQKSLKRIRKMVFEN